VEPKTFVVVGGGLAGATAVAALREEGFDGRVVLLADEPREPYERPELSKKYLRGKRVRLEARPSSFYADNAIDLRLGAAADEIDVAAREVSVDGSRLGFDALLLATGARSRKAGVPGEDLEGVVTLRTIDDADRIRAAAASARSIVVVGGGWIGSEVAASLRQLGRDVTLVVRTQAPLDRVLGPEVAAVYAAAHRGAGVRIEAGRSLVRLDGRERVEGVVLDDGRTIDADLVIVAVGAAIRAEVAERAGIAVDSGILVNARLESSVPGVFAAGDVANAWHPAYGRRVRVEHWDNAKRQGRAAAQAMLGRQVSYDRVPYFYSDQYDLGMEYRGFAPEWDEVVIRGDAESATFVAFWLRQGRVQAGMNVNVWDVGPSVQRLVQSAAVVDPRALADPDVALDSLGADAVAA